MPPRKKAIGPRPKRGVFAAATETSKCAIPEPTLSSPIKDRPAEAETASVQSPIVDAASLSYLPPNGAQVTQKPEENSEPQTRNCVEETLDCKDEKLENAENLKEETSGEGLGVKKKKIVKRKVVKVVKKLVKKRVPKGSIGSFWKEQKSVGRLEGELVGSSDGLVAKEAEGGPEELDCRGKVESLGMGPLFIEGGISLDGLDGGDDSGGISNGLEAVQDVMIESQRLNGGGGDDGSGQDSVSEVAQDVMIESQRLNGGGGDDGSGQGSVSEVAQDVKVEALDSGMGEGLTVSKVSADSVERIVDVSSEVGSSRIMDGCEGGDVSGENPDVKIDSSDSNVDKAVGTVDVNVDGDGNGMDVMNIVEESSEREIGEKEVGKGNDDEMANGGIVLSGELEALERRRRRKTEIFVGGLDPYAKEEDVRRVFEEVGEVLEVRMVINNKTGRGRGFAFVRYALAADAKKALEKYLKVEICGKQCKTAPVEGNDTIYLGSIDKRWKNEDVLKLLLESGIQKIDKVTVMTNPGNPERNRGFAFIEFETSKDAQIAFNILQKKDLPGKLKNVKVAWAEPLNEPDEEEMRKVKSVYAEYIPLSWDEEKVRNYFKRFGEIENVVLARNLQSSKRKDFAFVTFGYREAALACIESFNNGMPIKEKSEVNVKVSLAKPIPKGKLPTPKGNLPTPKGKLPKNVSQPASLGSSKQKLKSTHRLFEPMECRTETMPTAYTSTNRVDTISAASAKLEQLLADRALLRQTQERLGLGLSTPHYSHTLAGRKRPLSSLDDDMYHLEPQRYTCLRADNSFSDQSLRLGEIPPGIGNTFSYHQQQGLNAAPFFAPDYEHMDYAMAYRENFHEPDLKLRTRASDLPFPPRAGGYENGKGGYSYRFG